jgi:Cu(I)/Ag(I) efflux system periplasmic protein CusF
MNPAQTLLASAVLSLLSWGLAPAVAQTAPNTVPPLTEGVVRKIDKDNGKLTLRHEEIKNLDMPPMSMVFTVKDPILLDPLKVGDKVRFNAAREGGKIVVTEIQHATD